MTEPSVIEVRGADGAKPGPPVDGKPAPPLIDGNGSPGEASKDGRTCIKPATNGHPGNHGGHAPPALGGANGDNAPAVTMTVAKFTGKALTVTVSGGSGGTGVSGGKGGPGGPGGDAGKQPPACAKKYQDTVGGIGGTGGDGGTAGDGGKAGSGGIASVLWDERLGPDFAVTVTSTAGKPGNHGKPGDPGDPGQGGLNGDGVTRAHEGGSGSGGELGQLGGQGQSGSGTSSSVTDPADQLKLVVVPV
jgi:hypothetical protein